MTGDRIKFRSHASPILGAMTPASIFQPKESIGSILGAMTLASIFQPKESIGSILGAMTLASIFQPKESIGSVLGTMTPASITLSKESIGSILGTMTPASITLSKESIGSILGAMTQASITLPKESIGSILGAMTPASITLPKESIGNLFGSKSAYTYPALNIRLRRFEILLPLQFSNGRDVPAKMLAEARSELIDRFGAVSCESAEIEGYWRNDNGIVRDRLRRVWVDVPDLHSNLEWMRLYAERWRERLGQDELYSRNYEVESN